jgi:hypothetical protein
VVRTIRKRKIPTLLVFTGRLVFLVACLTASLAVLLRTNRKRSLTLAQLDRIG